MLTAIVPSPPPVADPRDTHWLNALKDDLALIDGELWDERRSDHPGARHRVELLEKRLAARRIQICDLRMKMAAYA